MTGTEQARAQALWAERQAGALSAAKEREYQQLKAKLMRASMTVRKED